MAEATAIKEKEVVMFAVKKVDADKDIAAMAKAVAGMDKRMAGAFLQTVSAQTLNAVIQNKKQLLMETCLFRTLGCAA